MRAVGCSASGLPSKVPSTTVNKVCASGMKSVMFGAQSISLGENSVVIAGGFESMSNTPFYLPKMRQGQTLGHGQVEDGIIKDGLWDPIDNHHMVSWKVSSIQWMQCALLRS